MNLATLSVDLDPTADKMPMLDMKERANPLHNYLPSKGMKMDAEGTPGLAKIVWIRNEERNVKVKILVNIHCGVGGHCRHEAT